MRSIFVILLAIADVQIVSGECDVEYINYVGNGFCDEDNYNTLNCNWDGGDCCESTCVNGTYTCGSQYNSGYEYSFCQSPAALYPNCDVEYINYVGDGYCDEDSYNTLNCNWDGGDCCESTCVNGTYTCGSQYNSGYEYSFCQSPAALYPNCDVEYINYVGDGYCDEDSYNTLNCNWDGGDCCRSTCVNGVYPCGDDSDCRNPSYSSCSSEFSQFTTLDPLIDFLLSSDTVCDCTEEVACSDGQIYSLSLSGYAIEGTIPQKISSLSILTYLNLEYNELSQLPTSFEELLPNMIKLYLGFNALTGTLPESWASGWSNLRNLWLNNNYLTGTLPESWGSEMSNLAQLVLEVNSLTGTLPESWITGWHEQVLFISLPNNHFTGTIPDSWGSSVSLSYIDLSSNALTGTLPELWAELSTLSMLLIHSNALTGTLPELWISAWGSGDIDSLTLHSNALTGSLPVSWASTWSGLKLLDLHDNDLTGPLPELLVSALSNLTDVYLYGNDLTGTLPELWTAGWSSLRVLLLDSNALTGTLPDLWASAWSSLISLKLNNNALTGTLPSRWTSSIYELVLSSNRFTGTLNEMMDDLHQLKYFSVANNQLTGTLPTSLSSLSELEMLDLSINAFTGSVPRLSETLIMLAIFHNSFSGTLILPNNVEFKVLLAHSNKFSSLEEEFWCNASIDIESLRCDLRNNRDANLRTLLTCGEQQIDIGSACDLKSPCASMESSTATTNVNLSSCGPSYHGQTCNYGCKAGFSPAIVGNAYDIQDVSTDFINDVPVHVATCVDGEWSFVDMNGFQHGCLEQSCNALLEDSSFNIFDSCAGDVPNATECLSTCLTGSVLEGGDGFMECSRGTWNSDSSCRIVDDVYSYFECDGLTDANIPNVEILDCAGLLGRTNIGFTSYDDTIYTLGGDFLSDISVDGRVRSEAPCVYTCKPGYYPNQSQDTVYCNLGKWEIPDGADCSARSCDDFWSEWKTEETFCINEYDFGKQYRTFVFDESDVDDVNDVSAAVAEQIGDCPFEDGTSMVSGFIEERDCPQDELCCERFSCNGFLSEWSTCSATCASDNDGDGGTMNGSFIIPTDDALAKAYYDEICDGTNFTVGQTTQTFPLDGVGTYTVSCIEVSESEGGGYPNCEARLAEQRGFEQMMVMVTIGNIIFFVILYLIILAYTNDLQARKMINENGKLGKACLYATGGNMNSAVQIVHTFQALRNQYMAEKEHFIWFSINNGNRTLNEAIKVIKTANKHKDKNKGETSDIENFEMAEWIVTRSRLSSLHKYLVDEATNDSDDTEIITDEQKKIIDEKIAASSQDTQSQKKPYLHIACATRWKNSAKQTYVVQQMLKVFPNKKLEHQYRPRPSLNPTKLTALDYALTRKCAPSIGLAIAQVHKAQIIGCDISTLSQLARLYPSASENHQLVKLVKTLLQGQLKDRIENQKWEDDAGSNGNGSSSFIPPCVKARDLKNILNEQAEVELQSDHNENGKTTNQKKNTVTNDIQEVDSLLVYIKDDPDFISKFKIGASKINGPPTISQNAKIAPLNTSSDDVNSTNSASVLDSDSHLVQIKYKDVWPHELKIGFICPTLEVLREFLELEIKNAADRMDELKYLCSNLMKGFKKIYTAIADDIETKDKEQLQVFNQMASQIELQLSETKPSQQHNHVIALYLACYKTQPFYEKFMDIAVEKTKAEKDSGSGVGPLKKMYRAFEKMAFREDDKQWSADCVLDIIRGSLVFDNMEDISNCLKFINECELVKIVRIKNRFKHPNGGGWRDCMLNVVCVDAPGAVVCEVQIIHKHLMLARKGMAGHNDYTTFRSGVELQEAVKAGLEHNRTPSKSKQQYLSYNGY